MGTRSLTTFIELYTDEKGKQKKNKVVTMYRQYDGYPDGHGSELAEFLSKGKMVNGIGVGDDSLQFNGIGCLAAQVVAEFKNGAGGIYLQKSNKNSGEEYRYHVMSNWDTQEITLKVMEVGYMKGDKYINKTKTLYEGDVSTFLLLVETNTLST